MSLWKFFEIPDYFREGRERRDPQTDISADVKTNEYPNYQIISDYNYKPEIPAGYHIIINGTYGFLTGLAVGIPFSSRKYRKLGYRDWKLMDRLAIATLKSSFYGTLIGVGIGVLFEIKRIANEDFETNYYNQKVFQQQKRPTNLND